MQPDQSQPTTVMDRFCLGWQCLCTGVFIGFSVCLWLQDSGYRFEAQKIGFFIFGGFMTFIGLVPRLLLDITRRIRQIRKLKWS